MAGNYAKNIQRQTRMNVALILPDGVGVRNYLYTNFFKEINKKTNKVWLIHGLADIALEEIKQRHPEISFHSFPLQRYKERTTARIFRETARFARLKQQSKKQGNTTFLDNSKKKRQSAGQKLFSLLIKITGYLVATSPNFIEQFEKWAWQTINKNYVKPYIQFYKQHQINRVLLLHQRAVIAVPAIKAAHIAGIKTATVIYSWDNVPKASLPVWPHKYFVWSEHMQKELLQYYPLIKKEQIEVTGTPQFEFYTQKQLKWSRKEFCKTLHVSPKTKLICYCGGDSRTSPYDPHYLRDLAETIRQFPREQQPKIVLRRTPVDNSGRYDNILVAYGDIIIESLPLWQQGNNGNWQQSIPLFRDVILLTNLIHHCHAAYTLGSTMAFDFAMQQKPAAFTQYNPKGAINWEVSRIYKYAHFSSLPDASPVYWIKNKEAITQFVEALITDNLTYPQAMDTWKEKIILHPVEEASKNLSKAWLNGSI